MNSHQKAAILAVRLVALVVQVVSATSALVMLVDGGKMGSEQFLGLFVWFLGGALLGIAARPLGKSIGSGLD